MIKYGAFLSKCRALDTAEGNAFGTPCSIQERLSGKIRRLYADTSLTPKQWRVSKPLKSVQK